MHAHTLDDFRHEHVFLGARHDRNERRTWAVIALCGAMMALEIGGGAMFGSMALIADGLHMSTHAGAMLIAALAYSYARRHARDERFSFGTGKLGDLAAFTSALILAMIAILIGYESLQRLLHPVSIAFREAIPIAILGLGVNLASAWLLRDDHDHHGHDHHSTDHHHDHAHDHHHHHDLNLRAAYAHVLADAAVSVLAIVGLLTAWRLHWRFMDPVMGVVGALVVANWSLSLIRQAGAVLLDMRPSGDLARRITDQLETGGDQISDLHIWRVGPGHAAAVISLVSDRPQSPSAYKRRLAGVPGLSHVTVEVEPCPGTHAPGTHRAA
ncbi:MAG TPA: CDF family Co(II)/Ni(II) efflux transporter DmeF [Phenylobacterium sp.]|nr:CDF family Co(II)/Ni(II) efflux transporter DmeF [Phenylobacterium sp.]